MRRTDVIRVSIAVLVAVILTGCGLMARDDPVAAVVASARLQYRAQPTVHASFPAGIGTIVLFYVESDKECYLGAMLAEPSNGKWEVSSGSVGSNHCIGAPPRAFSRDSVAIDGPFSWSLAKGVVFDSTVARVEVEWDDGVVTTATVTNDVYYSFRAGVVANVQDVRAYDAAGQRVSEEQ